MTVAVCMGSDSDYPTMGAAVEILRQFDIPHDVRVLSAHRMPHEMIAFGTEAAASGYKVIIAGAGGAAHLPGMLASVTVLPVIGVPVDITALDGMDSLLSIAQMPRGIPVATVAIGGATNAGLLAARILATSDEGLAGKLRAYAEDLRAEARAKNDRLPRDEQRFGFRNG